MKRLEVVWVDPPMTFNCPECGSKTKVADVKKAAGRPVRYRECLNPDCGYRFVVKERGRPNE